jgi:molybdenum cofactor biosynthesis protein B
MPQPHPDAAAIAVPCAVLTVSDTRTPDTDKSGDLMRSRLMAAQHLVIASALLKDEPEQVRSQIAQWVAMPNIAAILVNGGTGIAPRDTTYEAIAALLTKTLPGFGELFRMLSYEQIGSRAMASRAIAWRLSPSWGAVNVVAQGGDPVATT